jgi:hypothetical protein
MPQIRPRAVRRNTISLKIYIEVRLIEIRYLRSLKSSQGLTEQQNNRLQQLKQEVLAVRDQY